MASQSTTNPSNYTLEDRRIYGFGPERRMPYSCPTCLGTARLVKECRSCNGTGLMWDSSSGNLYQGKDEGQMTPGGSSQGSSSLSSYGQGR